MLTEQELHILDDLSNIEYKIQKLYDHFINLELNGQKNDDVYKDVLEMLQLKVIDRKKLIDSIDSDETIILMLNYLITHQVRNAFNGNINLIIDHDKQTIIQKRILSTLYNSLNNQDNYFTAQIGEAESIATGEEKSSTGRKYLQKASRNINENIEKRLADLLSKAAESEINVTVKRFLLECKYYISYLSDSIEKTYLTNGFNNLGYDFNAEIVVDEPVVAPVTARKVFDLYSVPIAIDIMKDLAFVSIKDMEDDINFSKTYVNALLFKVYLLFPTQGGVNYLRSKYTDIFSLNKNNLVKYLLESSFQTLPDYKLEVNKDQVCKKDTIN